MSSRTVGRSTSPEHLGATLRSVLIAPTAGFESALRTTERRARLGASPAEGVAPYLLSVLGGAVLFLLALKVAALFGARGSSAEVYRWGFLVAAGATGSLLALAIQFLWSSGAVAALSTRSDAPPARDLRLVWGAALFPQILALVLLLPLDLVIAGPVSFTNARPDDPVSSIWSSLSAALGVALFVWSVALLAKGSKAATGLSSWGAAGMAAAAGVLVTALVFAVRFLAVMAVGA